MPRKAPNLQGGVIEHRITFGDFERRELFSNLPELIELKKESLKIEKYSSIANSSINVVKPVLYVGVAAGSVWLLLQAWERISNVPETIVGAGLSDLVQYKAGLISNQELGERAQANVDRLEESVNVVRNEEGQRINPDTGEVIPEDKSLIGALFQATGFGGFFGINKGN